MALSVSYRKVIKEAWIFTLKHKRLVFWYGFFPSVFSILGAIVIWGYQFFSFKRSFLWEDAEHGFLYEVIQTGLKLIEKYSGWLIPAIIVITIIALFYFLLPTLLQGGIIQLIARIHNGQKVNLIDGLGYGFLVFLPLIEYNALTGTLSWTGMFIESTFVLRNFGTDMFNLILPVFIVATVFGFILAFLLTYASFYIVIDKKGVISAIGNSIKLVVLNWQETLLMLVLMMIIGLRIIVNVIFVLAVPIIVIGLAEYLVSLALVKIAIVVGIGLGLVALYFASYFSGILEVFSNAVWTFTFLELTSEKAMRKDLEGARIIEKPAETAENIPPPPVQPTLPEHPGLI